MKSLILAEKPSVARDIAAALNVNQKQHGCFENNKYIVTWALGHLVTNATPEQYDKALQTWSLEALPIIPNHMKTVVISKTRKQFQTVKSALLRKDVNEVIIATDAGREGELVARLILDKVNVKHPIKRLWISSVTKKAITQGFKSLKNGREFENLYAAALARSEADWVVGINATRALTTKYDAQLSLGRVQTPTIQLVQMRQDEINAFRPEAYYTLTGQCNGVTFKLIQAQRIKDKAILENEIEQLKGATARVTHVKKAEKRAYAPKLFNLTDLQQAAYKRYRMGAKETLNTLQNLYEHHKVVTYPRTDSNYLTDDMVGTLKERLQAVCATEHKDVAKVCMKTTYSAKAHFVNNQKVTDHHAIIPTEVRADMNALSMRERHIYMLIVTRFLENLLPPHRYEVQTVTLDVGKAQFEYKDNVTIEAGYTQLYEQPTSAPRVDFKEGDQHPIHKLHIQTHHTEAPPYFNEGSLLKAMESPQKFFELGQQKHAAVLKATGGIGTVATRADIIDKLFNLNAIEAHDGKIKVTQKGKQILSLAPEALTSPLLTAEWEEKLQQIERGKYNKQKFMDEIKRFTKTIIEEIKGSEAKYKHDNLTTTECPTCHKFMIKVKTKNGQMLVCQDPNCKTKKNVQRKTNARCPQCKKKLMLFGRGKEATYRCVCGHSETQKQMDQRMKQKTQGKVSKKDMKQYMQADDLNNNPFQDALKNLKL